MNLKTLVLHHDDRSTDFLKPIYADLPAVTVVTDSSDQNVSQLIREHDRVIMLGHDYPGGLFFMVNDSHASLLRQKRDNLYIWCHADQYVKHHGLTGLTTGMFISETGEATYSGIPSRTYSQSTVCYSNELLARLVAEKIHAPLPELHAHLLDHYQPKGCPIIEYNRKRIQLIEPAAASAKRIQSAAMPHP
jgi:hypothetical protein